MKQLIVFALLSLSLNSFAQDIDIPSKQDNPQSESQTTFSQAYPQSMQTPLIGYFSYDAVLKSMPEYQIVQTKLAELKATYDAEIKAVMKDFNEKYEYFLENQNSMADIIREKRQAELQSMLERNTAFRQETERMKQQAEEEGLKPLHDRINNALKTLASRKFYIAILNTDSKACSFLNPAMSEDVTDALLECLMED